MNSTIPWTAACIAALSIGTASANDMLAASSLLPGAKPAAVDADQDTTVADMAAELARLRQRIESLEGAVTPNLEMSAAISRLEARLDAAQARAVKVYHKDGLRIEGDGFKYRVGGRIHNDYQFSSADSDLEAELGDLEDGTEFRRARVYITGEYGDDVEFKAQYDFAGGDANFKDMYVRFKDVPFVDSLTVGQQKEPFGLEALMSSNYFTFLESASPSVFAPGRSTGIQIAKEICEGAGVFQFGVFRESDSFGDDDGDGEVAVTTRVAGAVVNEDGGRELVHLGASYSHRKPDDGMFRYRERPENHQLQRFVDTGTFDADEIQQYGFEFAMVNGPFSVQAEHIDVMVDSEAADDPNFSGTYGFVSYFLTGEHRAYKGGKFTRVVPNEPAVGKDATGNGAVEVAYRYSMLDLEDGVVTGGEMANHTLGLNWYLSRNVRVLVNYILSDVDDIGGTVDGDARIIAARLQIDF